MTSLRSKSEAVRSSAASASTCSSATVTALTELLLPSPTNQENASRKGGSKQSKNISSQSRLVKPTGKGSKAQSEQDESPPALTPKDRAVLATEVVNATLKVLSTSVKNISHRQPSSKEPLRTAARKVLRRSNSLPQSPLQQRHLNRVSSSPNISARESRSSSTSSTSTHSLRHVAECSRVAFACLRTLQTSKTACTDLPTFQLESGMSALIGKLIVLGLDDLALRELRILKRRLDSASKSKDGQSSTAALAGQQTLSFAELLEFSSPPQTSTALCLAIASQLQLLKLMATSHKPHLIASTISILRLDHPSSPAQLILKSAAEGSMQPTKAARQLEQCSQLILSLSPSISSSEDGAASVGKLDVTPSSALKLQVVAFQIRKEWWNLTKNQGDIQKEILEPFSRCLLAFARRVKPDEQDRYNQGQLAFAQISMLLRSHDSKDCQFMKVYNALATLAYDSGLYLEAGTWLEKARNMHSASKMSAIQKCIFNTRLTALKLRVLDENVEGQEVEALLRETLAGLDGQLKGECQEADELVMEVSLARRAAILLLSKASGSKCGIRPEILALCESLIYICPRFSLKYLGRNLDENDARGILRYEQRKKFLLKSVVNTIDSALFLMKQQQTQGRVGEALTDPILRDCLQLLDEVGVDQPHSVDQTSARTSYHVRISNLYYTQYLNLRKRTDSGKDFQALDALRQSVECLLSRSAAEKQASSLCLKLERLAEAYRTNSRYEDASTTLVLLINELVAKGALHLVCREAASHSLARAWQQSEETSVMERSLSLLVKIESKRRPESSCHLPMTGEGWSIEEKGLMLEHQLKVLSRHDAQASALQRQISQELLHIYDTKRFPVRRLRCATRILKLDLENRFNAAEEVKNASSLAGIKSIVQESSDAGLQSHVANLQALALSHLELLEEHPRIDLIKPHLATWCTIAEENRDSDTLSQMIDDTDDILQQLRAIAEFLDMKGHGKFRLAVLRLVANINEALQLSKGTDRAVQSFNDLAFQFLELGYSGKAGIALDKALSLIANTGASANVQAQVHVSHALYFLKLGSAEKCEDALSRAHAVYSRNKSSSTSNTLGRNAADRELETNLIASAYSVYSALAVEKGSPPLALWYAKQNLAVCSQIWRKLENERKATTDDSRNVTAERLTEEASHLELSNPVITASTSVIPLPTPAWGLVRPLFKSLANLSQLYSQHGMFQETMYYGEQALKVANAAGSPVYIASALVSIGATWLMAGAVDAAAEQLSRAQDIAPLLRETRISALLNCYLGNLHSRKSRGAEALHAYNSADSDLAVLMDPNHIQGLDRVIDPTAAIEAEMARLVLDSKKTAAKGSGRKTTIRRTAPTRKNDGHVRAPAELASSVSDECIELASLKGSLIRHRARDLLTKKRESDAIDMLKSGEVLAYSRADILDHKIESARCLIQQSLSQMVSDPVYSVLQDSTISFPAVVGVSKLQGQGADKGHGSRSTPPRRGPPPSRANNGRSRSPNDFSFFDKLRQAQEYLLEARLAASEGAPTAVLRVISSLLNTTMILLSAAGPPTVRAKSSMNPGVATCLSEMARSSAMSRERAIIRNPKMGSHLEWPSSGEKEMTTSMAGDSGPDVSLFQRDFVDIIPLGWTAISISLSESGQELCLSKLQSGHCPFVLRLPLGRNNSRDVDEEVFDFKQGRAELLDIIDCANTSAHAAQNVTGRGAKAAWWSNREALDTRLKEFLDNVEKVWLGGFKGIFSQHKRRPELLARFQQSFQNALDKHLPSRQATRRKEKAPRINLDTRILELFVGLGDPSNRDLDFDETITDLLYFVIDILQFHGERNAYDEIDFDSIAIETIDALRSYYQAIDHDEAEEINRHTILIVDKSLHSFPWESLPCMDSSAVSRLPSLECLRDRISGQEWSEADAPGHYVNASSGAYVLNPGGDLKTTQSSFKDDLGSLETCSGIVEREPSESEMKDMLQSKDFFLYFGHGSGSQYIRSKTIKKLDRCAVAMLMGCSSGALTEAGDFESYGPPMSYMLAGSPAVVATLWDITDKDIDRFARSTFESWGLFKSKDKDVRDGAKVKGKRNGGAEAHSRSKISLVEAVTNGRRACNFRYLTAAAVCVYGIPVYIR